MKKITVIGGGSTYTPELMEGLIKHSEEIGIEEVFLLDIEESEKFSLVAGLSQRMLEHHSNPFRLRYGLDIKDALTDADFVLQQYRPGFLEGRIKDETVPLKYDLIAQETTGVGGFSCALRALPIVEQYVEAVRKWANRNAFIINFTNPSGLISEFVINTLGFERFAGLCNIPINTIQTIAQTFDCKREDVFLNYYGLNHMSWIDKVFIKGMDRTDDAISNTYKPENIPESELFEKFALEMNMILNPYLRYYYTTKTMLAQEKDAKTDKGTRGEQVREIEKELLKKYADVKLYKKPEELEKRGGSMYSTAAVELLRDLCSSDKNNHIINLKNNGAIENLDRDYVLEINALVCENTIKPICTGRANPMAKGLIDTVKNFEKLTIEAHTQQSRKKAKEALTVHPLGGDIDILDSLIDDILAANSQYFKLL